MKEGSQKVTLSDHKIRPGADRSPSQESDSVRPKNTTGRPVSLKTPARARPSPHERTGPGPGRGREQRSYMKPANLKTLRRAVRREIYPSQYP